MPTLYAPCMSTPLGEGNFYGILHLVKMFHFREKHPVLSTARTSLLIWHSSVRDHSKRHRGIAAVDEPNSALIGPRQVRWSGLHVERRRYEEAPIATLSIRQNSPHPGTGGLAESLDSKVLCDELRLSRVYFCT